MKTEMKDEGGLPHILFFFFFFLRRGGRRGDGLAMFEEFLGVDLSGISEEGISSGSMEPVLDEKVGAEILEGRDVVLDRELKEAHCLLRRDLSGVGVDKGQELDPDIRIVCCEMQH